MEIPTGEHVEEVNLIEFDGSRSFGGSGSRVEAYHEDGDDEGQGGHPRMQCQHQ